jgi:diguanylate cyclase (GGDEF)-like protein
VVLVFGDINQFKAVNERYSHIAGDAAINRVGALLYEIATECGARAFRQSGDEFVLLLPAAYVDAFRTAAKDKLAAASVTYLSQTFDVGVSFGYVHADDGELHELLKKAEEACSIAKGESGSVVKWTAEISDGLPINIRHRCARCETKFDCWIPKREQSQLWCPGCGNAIRLASARQE